jgi:hypothetical protein
LAELEAQIAQAERTCARYRTEHEQRVRAGRDQRRPAAMLAIAEERVRHLRASREVLIAGEASDVEP